ncbi:MAG: hypothetical protein HC896_07805 [Bacteroidales bacterium]|nr:hypothetical protein [Bacteroidales bacterium]
MFLILVSSCYVYGRSAPHYDTLHIAQGKNHAIDSTNEEFYTDTTIIAPQSDPYRQNKYNKHETGKLIRLNRT